MTEESSYKAGGATTGTVQISNGDPVPLKDQAIITIGQAMPGGLLPQNFEGMWRLSKIMAASGMMQDTQIERIFVKIQMGLEVGLSPTQACQNIAVINGRPSIWGDAALGLVMSSGHLEEIDEVEEGEPYTDSWQYCCHVKRKGRKDVVRRFSYRDAQTAGLLNKRGPWQEYPRRMLQMRARSWALRDAFPDVLKGLLLREEATDITLHPQADGSYSASVVEKTKSRLADLREELGKRKETEILPPLPKEKPLPPIQEEEPKPMPRSTEAEEDLMRNALLKTFDTRVEKAGIPQKLVNDYLWELSQKTNSTVIETKAQIVKLGTLENTIQVLKKWAEEPEDINMACSQCRKPFSDASESIEIPDTFTGDRMYYCQECVPSNATIDSSDDIVPGDPDWRTLDPDEVISSFFLMRNPSLFRDHIRAHPEVMRCGPEVISKLRQKWQNTTKDGTTFGVGNIDEFWKSEPGLTMPGEDDSTANHGVDNSDDLAAQPPDQKPEAEAATTEWLTTDQFEKLEEIIDIKFGGWMRFMEWALYAGIAIKQEIGGRTLKRVTKSGAELVLSDPDAAKVEMVKYFNSAA